MLEHEHASSGETHSDWFEPRFEQKGISTANEQLV